MFYVCILENLSGHNLFYSHIFFFDPLHVLHTALPLLLRELIEELDGQLFHVSKLICGVFLRYPPLYCSPHQFYWVEL